MSVPFSQSFLTATDHNNDPIFKAKRKRKKLRKNVTVVTFLVLIFAIFYLNGNFASSEKTSAAYGKEKIIQISATEKFGPPMNNFDHEPPADDHREKKISQSYEKHEELTDKHIIMTVMTYHRNLNRPIEAKEHWLKNIDTYIATDKIPENDQEKIKNLNNFHALKFPNDPFLNGNNIGEGRWVMMFGYMHTVVKENPNIRWVFWGDDDTYFPINKALSALADVDYEKPYVLASVIHMGNKNPECVDLNKLCHWNPEQNDHRWFYGGNGAIISRGVFDRLKLGDVWSCLGDDIVAHGGGDTQVSKCILHRIGIAQTYFETGSKHRVHGAQAKRLCQQDGRC